MHSSDAGVRPIHVGSIVKQAGQPDGLPPIRQILRQFAKLCDAHRATDSGQRRLNLRRRILFARIAIVERDNRRRAFLARIGARQAFRRACENDRGLRRFVLKRRSLGVGQARAFQRGAPVLGRQPLADRRLGAERIRPPVRRNALQEICDKLRRAFHRREKTTRRQRRRQNRHAVARQAREAVAAQDQVVAVLGDDVLEIVHNQLRMRRDDLRHALGDVVVGVSDRQARHSRGVGHFRNDVG